VGGIKFAFDPSQPVGSRLVQLAVLDANGDVADAVVVDGELAGSATRKFRVVTLDFLAGGGDGYPFPSLASNRVDLRTALSAPGASTFAVPGSEQDALAEYLLADFSTTAYSTGETDANQDERIQILSLRADSVYAGAACFTALTTRPANLRTDLENPATVQLLWDAVPNTQACQLYLGEVGSTPSRIRVETFEPSFYSVPVSRLEAGVDYVWSVRCACSLDPLAFGPLGRPDTFSLPESAASRLAEVSSEVQLTPNPAADLVQVNNLSEASGSWMLYDALGQLRASGQWMNSNLLLSVQDYSLNNGVYWLQLNGGGQTQLKELVVVR
jgi:hypothetical protein